MRKPYIPAHDTLHALRWFADLHGRNWKAKLREHWEDGTNPSVNPQYNADLRALRNSAGPSWLKTFKLPK